MPNTHREIVQDVLIGLQLGTVLLTVSCLTLLSYAGSPWQDPQACYDIAFVFRFLGSVNCGFAALFFSINDKNEQNGLALPHISHTEWFSSPTHSRITKIKSLSLWFIFFT